MERSIMFSKYSTSQLLCSKNELYDIFSCAERSAIIVFSDIMKRHISINLREVENISIKKIRGPRQPTSGTDGIGFPHCQRIRPIAQASVRVRSFKPHVVQKF